MYVDVYKRQVYNYDTEIKVQSTQWNLPEEQDKKKHHMRSNMKGLLTVFFYYSGIVYYKLSPSCCTVNKEILYLEVLRQLPGRKTTRNVGKQYFDFAPR